jgi:hypothetical protein
MLDAAKDNGGGNFDSVAFMTQHRMGLLNISPQAYKGMVNPNASLAEKD